MPFLDKTVLGIKKRYFPIVSEDKPIYNQGCYNRIGIALANNTELFDSNYVTACTNSCSGNKARFTAVMVSANALRTIQH